MKRLNIRVTVEHDNYVKSMSKKYNTPESEVYRQIVSDFINRNPLKDAESI